MEKFKSTNSVLWEQRMEENGGRWLELRSTREQRTSGVRCERENDWWEAVVVATKRPY